MNEPMEKTDWNQLVQRESAKIEWKENVANPQNVVKTISAFANDFQQVGGGLVVCGLKEEKNQYGEPTAKVLGLDEKRFKEVKNKVLDYCHRYVEPPLTPEVNDYPVENDPSRRILVFAVPSSPYAHRYRTKKGDVNYYIRVNDQTRTADGLIPQLLERKKVWPPYMEQTHPEVTLADIDMMALREFLGKLKLPHPVEKYLEPGIRFRGDVHDLVTHPPGRTDVAVPRNFTILLFGREPHRFFRGAYAIFSVYHGLNKASERSERYEIFGPIPVLIRNLMNRLQFYMGIHIDKAAPMLSGNRNRSRFSERAVQEAIVNAFVHRDYHSYDPVRVTVFNDRLEITSPGGAPAPLDPEKIREGKIHPSWRNPSLAWFMVKLEFAQNEGQGIFTIIDLTRSTAGKEPQFSINSHWFDVIIPAYVPPPIHIKEKTKEKFDIKVKLPVLRDAFDQLKNLLEGIDQKLEKELDKIEDRLDEVTTQSPKEKFIKPLNKLGRLLNKLADRNSRYHNIIKNSPEKMEAVRELAAAYHSFAEWIPGLPMVPDLFYMPKK